MDISISRTTAGNVPILAVSGDVDVYSAPALKDKIGELVGSGEDTLIVDLGKVTFLDSTGISALVAGRNLAGERGVAYVVINPHDMVRRVLDVAGVLATLTGQS